MVADEHGLTDRPLSAQAPRAVGEHDGSAARGGSGPHGVGDDIGIVTLVQMHAAQVEDHLAPSHVDRAQRATVSDRRWGGEPREVRERELRAHEAAEVGAAPPTGAQDDCDVVTLRSRSPVQRRRGLRGERERVLHGWDPTILPMRTIEWRGDHAVLVDQTRLPHEVVMARGARRRRDDRRDRPPRGARRSGDRGGGAFGVAIAAQQAEREDLGPEHVRSRGRTDRRRSADRRQPGLGRRRVLARLDEGAAAVVAEAVAMADEDVETNRRLAARGADLLEELVVVPARVHTHCNTGGLATVEWGTALGIVRELNERGHLVSVTADETRPLLQGSRLTAFELADLGIEHRIVVDGAGPSVISRGLADAVLVGADRIAANGDVANKIGTYPLALAAARAGIPFIVAAPESTLDPATATGADIEIEERAEEEVLAFGGTRTAPAGSRALQPCVRRDAGRPRDGDRHRAPRDPPGPGRSALTGPVPPACGLGP